MAKKLQPVKKRTEIALRRANAIKLRVAGATDAQIMEQLGYSNESHVRKDIQRALKAHAREETKELLDLELMRLDHLQLGLTQGFDGGDRKLADQILRVMTRRSQYLGLDASDRKGGGDSDIDRWLAGLVGDKPDLALDPGDLGEEVEDIEDIDDLE